MHRLVALTLPGGPDFVTALRRTWDDDDAAFVLDARLPAPAARQVLDAMAPALVRTSTGDETRRGSRPVKPGDALVVATSGTSGEPKGVVLTHAAVAASAHATSARIGVRDDDHWLACLPLAHVGGLSVVTRALALGTPLTVLPGFDPTAVAASPATLISLVATALTRIDPTRFRVIVLGGAAPPPNRPANCVTTYGMTETGSGVVYDGVPLNGVHVRLNPDGEIHLQGPMLLRSYRDGTDPKDTAGWLPTGDLGTWDGHRLVVHGRRGDMIITGGENVWPDAVERALAHAPGVADLAVAGRPDPEWGQRVVAFVVPADRSTPPTLEDLRARVKESLPAYCAPRQLVLVDALPRTNLGKVRRSALGAVGEVGPG
jgi:O-succinylbenzoic acid--CoA ligase